MSRKQHCTKQSVFRYLSRDCLFKLSRALAVITKLSSYCWLSKNSLKFYTQKSLEGILHKDYSRNMPPNIRARNEGRLITTPLQCTLSWTLLCTRIFPRQVLSFIHRTWSGFLPTNSICVSSFTERSKKSWEPWSWAFV